LFVKIATWNVNGIRARAGQVCEFLEKERPDVLCLQELKANVDQVPLECRVTDYHIYWHGSTMKAYSGVSLHLKDRGEKPAFAHPSFDMESRIVAGELGNTVFASVYVPNGGKDYPAKLAFLRALADWAKRIHAEGKSSSSAATSTSPAPSATCTRSSGATSSASCRKSARYSRT